MYASRHVLIVFQQLPRQQLLSERAPNGRSEGGRQGRSVSNSFEDQQVQKNAIASRFDENEFGGFWEAQGEARLGGEIVARVNGRRNCHSCLMHPI